MNFLKIESENAVEPDPMHKTLFLFILFFNSFGQVKILVATNAATDAPKL